MKILVCNDDGATAPGIRQLAEAAKIVSEDVWIVGPDRKWTAASHQLTFDTDLILERLQERVYTCSGAPADCVIAALDILFGGGPMPALVLSGVNDKRNVAEDIAYSGTMAIAREACFWGIPAIALSRDPVSTPSAHDTALIGRLLQVLWESRTTWATPGHWLSVNLPASLPASIRQARLGRDKIGGGCDIRTRNGEQVVYRNRRGRPGTREEGDENAALLDGHISLVRHGWRSTDALSQRAIASLNARLT